jgi:heptosyltransferase-3
MPDTRRALIYRPGSLGDTLVSLPAIAEIRRRFPAHKLTLLTERPSAAPARVSPWTILEATGWFDAAHFYIVKPATLRDRAHNVKLALKLRGIGYDEIFSLAPRRTARQLRVDSTIFRGVVRPGRYHAAGRPAWPIAADETAVEYEGLRLLRIVDPAATIASLLEFRLAVPDADRERGEGLLSDLGVRGDQLLIGVGPGSGRSTTTWPIERFAAVGSALLEHFRNVVLLAIGGAKEQSLCQRLCEQWGPRSHNLAGRLSVFGSASVLSRCAMFIGNDSGPTHLAAVVGVPCVAIYSARNARGLWELVGPDHVVLEERPACAGCRLDDCVSQANKCLTSIGAGRVLNEAISMIESRRLCHAH